MLCVCMRVCEFDRVCESVKQMLLESIKKTTSNKQETHKKTQTKNRCHLTYLVSIRKHDVEFLAGLWNTIEDIDETTR